MNREDIKNIVRSMVQPLMRATFDSNTGLKSKLKNIVPFGTADNFSSAMPFGFSSRPRAGVLGYFQNLWGNSQNAVILNHMDTNRPTPSSEGETIVYCSPSGAATPVRITLKTDGTLKIEASSKVEVVCDNIALGQGSLEKILNGETFRTQFLAHTHLGNLGVPTGVVMQPFAEAEVLSTVVKAKK